MNEQSFVDPISHCVEHKSYPIHNWHATSIHLNNEKGRHHSRVGFFSLKLFACVQFFKISLDLDFGVGHIIIFILRVIFEIRFEASVPQSSNNDDDKVSKICNITQE